MDEEAGRVWRSGTVSADDFAVKVNENHIANLEESKMTAQGIRPESVGKLRVTNRNVTTHSFDVALPVPVTKSGSHMLQLPLPVGCKVWVCWNSFQDNIAMRHCLKWRLVLEFIAVSCVRSFLGLNANGAA